MGARLGQHFLIHSWAARALAHAVRTLPGEPIVEIGPGKGVLTRELLALGNPAKTTAGRSPDPSHGEGFRVIAIEKDGALVMKLRETFPEALASGQLELVEADIRDVNLGTPSLRAGGYTVAANIPYYITGEIIRQFLENAVQPRAMALLIQKEVARRITSEKGSILSISVRAYGTPRIVDTVSRRHFSPPPSVDSAILAIDNISKAFFADISEEQFFAVVRAGFASKRKMLANNLSNKFPRERVLDAFAKAEIPLTARAEDIVLKQWKSLAKFLQ